MIAESTFKLVNPADKKLAFSIEPFEDGSRFDSLQRLPYSSVIWITHGQAELKVNFSVYNMQAGNMLFLSPYQPFAITGGERIRGVMINFHPEFFCLFKHTNEIAFCGLLFNNVYQSPMITITEQEATTFWLLADQLKTEVRKQEVGQHDLLVALLKVFFIHASRIRMAQSEEKPQDLADTKEPFILQNLKNAIDAYYREKHSASEYAEMLNVTPKTLGRITKTHFNKTLTDLISERLIIEAKRELYMTQKTVKEIAYHLGFNDEYYFSRYFKNATKVSPQAYRASIGTVDAVV